MGTLSTTKFIKNSAGNLAEEAMLTTTAGAIDANKAPALNANGVLDISILNGKVASAGAADAGKSIFTDAAGKLDPTMLPSGIGADTQVITASEALSAGDYVNVWSNAGFKVRKADATVAGKEAHGFVLSNVIGGGDATVYFEGSNTAVTGQTAGVVFLGTVAGSGVVIAPSGAGSIVQRLGFATSPTSVNFQSQVPITLAL
jgi:hypothetical protein